MQGVNILGLARQHVELVWVVLHYDYMKNQNQKLAEPVGGNVQREHCSVADNKSEKKKMMKRHRVIISVVHVLTQHTWRLKRSLCRSVIALRTDDDLEIPVLFMLQELR